MSTNTATPSPAMRRSLRAFDKVESIRDAIREALDQEHRAELVGDLARDLAKAEQEFQHWNMWGAMQSNGGMTEDEATAEIVKQIQWSIVVSGANDTWSGRGNDMRRAAFDGTRSFLDNLGVAWL